MADILHDLTILAAPGAVCDAVTSPMGLASWWTRRSAGEPKLGASYQFYFSPEHDWRGVVKRFEQDRLIEWEITNADADWSGTRVGFELTGEGAATRVSFRHTGWREANAHFRDTSFGWATYLRLLKRYIEHGEMVAYEERDAL